MTTSPKVQQLVHALAPSRTDLILAVLLGAIWLLLPEIEQLFQAVTGVVVGPYNLDQAVHQYDEVIRKFGTVVVVLFWMLVGLIGYCLIYMLNLITNELRNDIVIAMQYTNRGSNPDSLVTKIGQGCLALIVAGLLLILVSVLPSLTAHGYQFTSNPTLLNGAYALAALVLIMLLVILPWRLFRLVFLLPTLTSRT